MDTLKSLLLLGVVIFLASLAIKHFSEKKEQTNNDTSRSGGGGGGGMASSGAGATQLLNNTNTPQIRGGVMGRQVTSATGSTNINAYDVNIDPSQTDLGKANKVQSTMIPGATNKVLQSKISGVATAYKRK